ncbi:hypothetical protein D3C80_598340 [compost metagenome]
MGRVALKVALQRAIGPRQGQFVIRQGEMVHADVHVTGFGQAADGQLQQLQLALRRWHVLGADHPLCAHQLGKMGVAVGGNTVRAQGDDLAQGDVEALHRLQRQAVDQVDADRFELRLTRRRDQGIDLFFALPAIDRRLHIRIEILHTETQAVEAQAA